MPLPKGTKLELYIMFWDSINDPTFSGDIHYHISQYIFKRVMKHTPKFSMNDARKEYNSEMHRRFNALSQADQTTVMIMNKLPENAQYTVKE